MIWIVYALLSAMFSTVSTIFRKKTIEKEHSITFLTANKLFQLVALLVILPFINFYLSLATYSIIAIIAVLSIESDIFWTKALKRLNISIATPLTNLSPAIIVILAYFILGEKITFLQLIGVILIVFGAYVLEADHGLTNTKQFLLKLKKSKYSILLFLSLIIGGFSAIGERYMLGNKFIDPMNLLFFSYLFTTILVLTFQLNDDKNLIKVKQTIKRSKFPLIVTAIAGLLNTAFYYLAIKTAYISLVMPILLTSTLLTTIIGGELFKENNILYKSVACLIMLLGVFLIIGISI
ncbi:MAG: DMT family transporter [Candidatus Nanoarchaeia archaeon]|nr:DMT family transporter [Candidatus Nanoarchaeia archaeon]